MYKIAIKLQRKITKIPRTRCGLPGKHPKPLGGFCLCFSARMRACVCVEENTEVVRNYLVIIRGALERVAGAPTRTLWSPAEICTPPTAPDGGASAGMEALTECRRTIGGGRARRGRSGRVARKSTTSKAVARRRRTRERERRRRSAREEAGGAPPYRAPTLQTRCKFKRANSGRGQGGAGTRPADRSNTRPPATAGGAQGTKKKEQLGRGPDTEP